MADQWWNDRELIDELAEALHAAQEVPREFIDAGKAAYSWRNIDAELAALTYDSAVADVTAEPPVRAEPATLRALTFVAPNLALELELADDTLQGQLVPPQSGEVEIRTARGVHAVVPVDDVGYFVVRALPPGPFRVSCRTGGGLNVLTNWIAL